MRIAQVGDMETFKEKVAEAYERAQELVDKGRVVAEENSSKNPYSAGWVSSIWIPVGHDERGIVSARVDVDNGSKDFLPDTGLVDGNMVITFARGATTEALKGSARIKESTHDALSRLIIPHHPDDIGVVSEKVEFASARLDSLEESLGIVTVAFAMDKL